MFFIQRNFCSTFECVGKDMKSLLHREDTIVALATPPGQSALAVIRMSGKHAMEIVAGLFRSPKGNVLKPDVFKFPCVKLGNIFREEKLIDEVVITLYRAPKSFTGEDMVEISCHGSPYIVRELIKLFMEKGARMAEPGEFTLRAFLNGKLDLTKAESVADLIASESGLTHEVVMQQYRGDYRKTIETFREELIQFLSLLELELDFAEEDVEFAHRDEFLGLLEKLRDKMKMMCESFEWGNAMKKGIPAVIMGKPNAGKSTLMNALARDEKSIVSDIPGTTRDAVEDVVVLQGIPFRFTDTAGLRNSSDIVEQMGVSKAISILKKSPLLIYVFDLTVWGPGDVDEEKKFILKDVGYQGKILWVGNKTDLVDEKNLKMEFDDKDFLFISAKNRVGIDNLEQRLVEEVKAGLGRFDGQIVTNARHVQSLKLCLEILEKIKDSIQRNVSAEWISSDIRAMIRELDKITGSIVDEEILDYIFSNFCIGK